MLRPYRMRFLLAFSCVLAMQSSRAQKQFNVLDWKSDVSLNSWLVSRMHDQYDKRSKEFNRALSSRKATEAYIQDVRNKYLRLLGSFPERSPLQAKTTGVIHAKGYRVEKLMYESFPGHHVTTNLYIPDGKGPFPGVLLFCGHEDISKATESYQKTAILFALNGFVVLVVDPVSQSERYQLTDKNGKPLVRGGTTEHTLLNEASNLLGTSCPAYELWDNVRSLDYLVSRSEVDTTRIGCLGNSGGGMQTIYFAGYEKRVKVMAVCSFLMSRQRALELTGPSDGCSHIPNEGRYGFEMSDFLIAAAPRPVLVLAGRYDFIDYAGTVAAYGELKKVYASLGQPEKVRLFTYDDGHGISRPKREEAASWFRKWLYHDQRPVREEILPTQSEKELLVTSSGQVAREFPGEVSISDRNLKLYDQAYPWRQKFLQQDRTVILEKIKSVLSLDKGAKPLVMEEKDPVGLPGGQIVFKKLILRKEGEVPVPVLVVYPAGQATRIIVWFNGEGKNRIADSITLIRSYLENHCAVVLADVRGMGETEDRADMNDPKYYNREYRNAMLALHIGKPLVGQRVRDMGTVLDFIDSDTKLKNLPVEVNATGAASLPALHATLLFKQVSLLKIQALPSFRDILQRSFEKNWYSNVITGVLNYYDVPDLVKLIGENRIHIGSE